MPLDVADFDATRGQLTAFAGNRAPDLGTSPVDALGELIGVIAQVAQGIGESQQRASAESPPSADTSDSGTDAWAYAYGLPNGEGGYGARAASAAQGFTAYLTGENGTNYVLPQQASANGVLLTLRTTVTIPGAPPGSGQVLGSWDAVDVGTSSNLTAGTVLQLLGPPGTSDPTITLLTGPAVPGRDAATQPQTLAALQYRMQRPPSGGNPADYRDWAENPLDPAGEPITTLTLRAYNYPNYDGVGSPMNVLTVAGTGQARIPSADLLAADQLYIEGDSATQVPGQQPAGPDSRMIPPYMPTERALSILCRCVASLARYKNDWVRGTTVYAVNSFAISALPSWVTTAGGNAVLELTGLAPADLKSAITALSGPRIFVDTKTAGAFTGPVIPEQAACLAFQDAAGRTSLALAVSSPTNWLAWVQPGNEVYSGGDIIDPVAIAIRDQAVDNVGPSRQSGLADPADPWTDIVSIGAISGAAQNATDTDGVSRFVARTVTGGVTIAVGPLGTPAVQDITATDNTFNGPELLYAGRILVTD